MPSKIAGKGLVAIEPIKKNELVVVKAGRIVDKETLYRNEKIIRGAESQLHDDLFIAPMTKSEFKSSMGYVNHSCESNVGYGGNVLVIAMRDINPGEEITLDYAMQRDDEQFRLECNCQTKSCRKVITGNDWKIPELQEKYSGYFQWYLEHKIKAMNGQKEV